MATPEQIELLRARLNSGTQQGSLSSVELGLLYDQASELIDKYRTLPGGALAAVPTATLTRCTLDAADRLHVLEVSPNGQVMFNGIDGNPVPTISRDPLIAVYPIIGPYLPAGVA